MKLNNESGRPGDVANLTADPSMAERELGFTASRDLQSICRDLWNWQTKNPHGYPQTSPRHSSQIGFSRNQSLHPLQSRVSLDILYTTQSNALGGRRSLTSGGHMCLLSASDRLAIRGNDMSIIRDESDSESPINLHRAVFAVEMFPRVVGPWNFHNTCPRTLSG
jgi:hypothetical protein